ncbi:sensor histidine kinase [Tessaracoccus sp.]
MVSPSTTTRRDVAHHKSPAAMGRRMVGYGISLLAALGIVVAASDVLNPQYPWLMRVGVALCLSAQVLVIIECLRPSRLLWGITVAAFLGILLITAALLLAPTPLPVLGWRTNTWLGPVLQFLVLLHPHRRIWQPLSVLTLACWTGVTLVQQLDWHIQVMDLVFTIAPMASLGIAGACITNLLFELRLSQVRRLQDERDTLREEARAQQRRMRTRLVHDSILHTLQQISRGWAPPTPAEASMLASSTARDLQAGYTGLDSTRIDVRSALELALQDQGCSIVWRGGSAVVPAPVCEAVVAAAREAVRNVVKHAHGAATVTVSRGGGGCRVTVVDDGPGVDSGMPVRGRLGMVGSIISRMEDVGGHAFIRSGALGTAVTLEWADEPFGRVEPFGPMARTLVSWLPIPVLAASLVHVVVLDVGPSNVGAAMIWLSVAAVCVLGMWRLRISEFSWWEPLVLTALAIAVIVANYLWISPVGTDGYDLWTPSLVGALMVLALPGRQLVQAAALATSVIVATVAACAGALGWQAVVGSQLGSIMAVLMYVLTPLALATGASILAAHSRRTEELHAVKRLRVELAAEQQATHRGWVERMQAFVEPFLLELARGTADPCDESVIRRARILEMRLRDELSLWPHSMGVTDRVHELRVAGWECTLDVTVTHDAEKDALIALMGQLPAPLPGQHLHITNHGGEAVGTVTNPPFTESQWHELENCSTAVRDEDFTQLRNPPTLQDPTPLRART